MHKAVDKLTVHEAINAMRIDLLSYGMQRAVVSELLLLLKSESIAAASPDVALSLHKKRECTSFADWRELVSTVADQLDTQSGRPDVIAAACSIVFQTPAQALGTASEAEILLYTGMEDFACTRCGRCCVALDIHDDCSAEDVRRWEAAGREDILAWVQRTATNSGESYSIWVRPGTTLYAESCPWLKRVPGDTAFYCSIQDVKPEVCRAYPGLRKHGILTGCKGFGQRP